MRWSLGMLVIVGLSIIAPNGTRAQSGPERNLVIIDAGHGGIDPGARGASGTLEKDVALAVARHLEEMLLANGGYEILLTRRGDALIPLHERALLANHWRDERDPSRPALFVSIHTNAHERRTARGFETYFLSEALTEEARRVAALENAARRFEPPDAVRDPLSFILTDLRRNLYHHESSEGAAIFQRRLASVHPGPDRGVKQAAFVVLEGAFMPAILVELGFITHADEERLLASPDFQRASAGQLALAIQDFFSRSAFTAGTSLRR